MVCSKQKQWLWSSWWFPPILYPTYSMCSTYIMCPASKALQPVSSYEGQKLTRVWMDTHVSSARVQLPLYLCPLSLCEMADLAWQMLLFAKKVETPEFCVRPPKMISLAINFFHNIVSHTNACCGPRFASLNHCCLASEVDPSLPNGLNFKLFITLHIWSCHTSSHLVHSM